MRGGHTRRQFLRTSLGAAAALPFARFARPAAAGANRLLPLFPDPARGWRGASSVALALRAGWRPEPPPAVPRQAALQASVPLGIRFPDAPRHFVFEYYPWYGTDPFRHWNQWDRIPPIDIAANHVPLLGPYDSRSTAVLERHARWILEAGAGAVDVSWWGRGSFEDRAVHVVMDVMHAHGLKVTFHIEPYANDRSRHYVDDILYLVREYGEKRHWDAFLLLKDEDGSEGPVLKSFRTILPEEVTDCHGVRHRVPDFTPDGVWAAQLEVVRRALRHDFDRVRLLADSLHMERVATAGFDGIAIYDHFVPPFTYVGHAATASARRLLFSFNVNPGFDTIEPRFVEPGSCYAPTPFAPPAQGMEWWTAEGRERAAALARQRMTEAMEATLAAQTDPALLNARRGFFLVYLNSFNEWHEGHAMEPMKDYEALSREEKSLGYHNPARGDERLRTLRGLVADAFTRSAAPAEPDSRPDELPLLL